ncbi:MAG: DUF4129 domain-containing protein [Niabella sp.]
MRIFWCILLWFGFSQTTLAQQAMPDSSTITHQRRFSSAQLNEWRQQRQFRYDDYNRGLTWWQKLKQWFWLKVAEIFRTRAGRTSFWAIVILLSLAIIAFVVWKLTGKGNSLWERRNKGEIIATEISENIHEINFAEAISKALQEKNYRLAVRLQYLQLLKLLTGKELIHWQAGKTHRAYMAELWQEDHAHIVPEFKEAAGLFDYAWYSDLPVSSSDYDSIYSLYQSIQEKTSQKEAVTHSAESIEQ